MLSNRSELEERHSRASTRAAMQLLAELGPRSKAPKMSLNKQVGAVNSARATKTTTHSRIPTTSSSSSLKKSAAGNATKFSTHLQPRGSVSSLHVITGVKAQEVPKTKTLSLATRKRLAGKATGTKRSKK